MKNTGLLFAATAVVFGTGWLGVVGASYEQFGRLQPIEDAESGQLIPPTPPGLALHGQRVYAQNACASCHTMHVRGPEQGSDLARKWGERRSAPRDNIHRTPGTIGFQRFGPDLANVGAPARKLDAPKLYALLYDPQRLDPFSQQPPYRFLFEYRKVVGQPSPDAVQFPDGPAAEPGFEVIPTYEAKALAAFLLAQNPSYSLPEAPKP